MNGLKQLIQGVLFKIYRQDFFNAYGTAKKAHEGYFRRNGDEYFEHPKAVRNIVRRYYPEDYIAQLVALLHDQASADAALAEFQTIFSKKGLPDDIDRDFIDYQIENVEEQK